MVGDGLGGRRAASKRTGRQSVEQSKRRGGPSVELSQKNQKTQILRNFQQLRLKVAENLFF